MMEVFSPFLIVLGQILLFAVGNSLAAAGVIETIKTLIDHDPDDDQSPNVHRYIKMGITFALAFLWCLYLKNVDSTWQKLGLGFFIFSTSVLIYKVTVKWFLEALPAILTAIKDAIVRKFSGDKSG